MKQTLLAAVLCVLAAGALAGPARADRLFAGEYIAWRIEEFSGGRWSTLDASFRNRHTEPHCELASAWPWIGACDSSRGARGEGVNPFYSSAFRVKPTRGRRYRVILKNLTSCRLAVTLDVDGKNTVDSRDVAARAGDRAWVLKGNKTVSIEGFQLDSASAMQFYWTDPDDAHSNRRDKMGAINMYVYFEDSPCAEDRLVNACSRSLNKRGSPEIGTGAGDTVSQPVEMVHFDDLTQHPVEIVRVAYSDRVSDRAPDQPCVAGSGSRNNSGGSSGSGSGSVPGRSSAPGAPPALTPPPPPLAPAPQAPPRSDCYLGLGVQIAETAYAGVNVISVYADSPAWRAGIRPGDTLVKVGAANVNSLGELTQSLAALRAGDPVDVALVQNGNKVVLPVVMGYACP